MKTGLKISHFLKLLVNDLAILITFWPILKYTECYEGKILRKCDKIHHFVVNFTFEEPQYGELGFSGEIKENLYFLHL